MALKGNPFGNRLSGKGPELGKKEQKLFAPINPWDDLPPKRGGVGLMGDVVDEEIEVDNRQIIDRKGVDETSQIKLSHSKKLIPAVSIHTSLNSETVTEQPSDSLNLPKSNVSPVFEDMAVSNVPPTEPSLDSVAKPNREIKDRKGVDKGQIKDRKEIDQQVDEKTVVGRKGIDKGHTVIAERVDKRIDEGIENGEIKGRKTSGLKLSLFTGLQRDVLLYLFNNTKYSREYLTTDELSINDIANEIQRPKTNTKNVIIELTKKLAIFRFESKIGAGGWTRYLIDESLYNSMVFLDTRQQGIDNGEIKGRKGVDEKVDKRVDDLSSSSSFLDPSSFSMSSSPIPKTTTTDYQPEPEPKEIELPDEWKEINFVGLIPIHFGRHHIKQIFSAGKVSAEITQESIHHLAHDLKVGGHGLNSPLAVLLKALRVKGEPYTSIKGYVSDDQRYEMMKLAELKRQKEESERIKYEITELEAELSASNDNRFREWARGLTADQRKEYAPEASIDKSNMQLGLLKAYWEKNKGFGFTRSADAIGEARTALARTNDEIRTYESKIRNESNPSTVDILKHLLDVHKTKRSDILSKHPQLIAEMEEIEAALNGLSDSG